MKEQTLLHLGGKCKMRNETFYDWTKLRAAACVERVEACAEDAKQKGFEVVCDRKSIIFDSDTCNIRFSILLIEGMYYVAGIAYINYVSHEHSDYVANDDISIDDVINKLKEWVDKDTLWRSKGIVTYEAYLKYILLE